MATECTPEAVICFLAARGGRVKNADLMNHFRSFVSTEPERKAAGKEAFQGYVESVAVEQVENGEKYVCLRKRFRGSVERGADHHGPDRAKVLEMRASAAVTHDNRREDRLTPVKPAEPQRRALNTTGPSENKYEKQELPAAAAAAASLCAGACTPPNISQTCPDGSGVDSVSRPCASVPHGSGEGTEMGAHHARTRRSVQRSDEPAQQTKAKCARDFPATGPSGLPADPQTRSMGRADQSHAQAESAPSGAGSGPPRPRTGSCDAGADEGRSDSDSNASRGSRKSFIEHMMSSSPQVRRSLVHRHSRHADKSDGDASSVQSDIESAAVATLDPVEHEWMMCACDGEWDSLHRLLNGEPNLVSKKDFVTGFTCLHWAAKMGKHELLAQIVNFARRRGVALDVNARSSAGYTPLHLAAMHNHVEVIKLLVGACDADVEVRDYNGKKPSQYLRSGVARDVLDITGVVDAARDRPSEELALGDEAARWRFPRALQTNLKLLSRSVSEEDDRDCVGGLARDRPLRRKSSLNKLKPRLSKVRAGITPIVHSTSHFDRLEGAAGNISALFRNRPKSNLFG